MPLFRFPRITTRFNDWVRIFSVSDKYSSKDEITSLLICFWKSEKFIFCSSPTRRRLSKISSTNNDSCNNLKASVSSLFSLRASAALWLWFFKKSFNFFKTSAKGIKVGLFYWFFCRFFKSKVDTSKFHSLTINLWTWLIRSVIWVVSLCSHRYYELLRMLILKLYLFVRHMMAIYKCCLWNRTELFLHRNTVDAKLRVRNI